MYGLHDDNVKGYMEMIVSVHPGGSCGVATMVVVVEDGGWCPWQREGEPASKLTLFLPSTLSFSPSLPPLLSPFLPLTFTLPHSISCPPFISVLLSHPLVSPPSLSPSFLLSFPIALPLPFSHSTYGTSRIFSLPYLAIPSFLSRLLFLTHTLTHTHFFFLCPHCSWFSLPV